MLVKRMTSKVWRRLPSPPAGFAAEMGFPPFQAHLLYNRGIRRRSEIDPFLAADARLQNDPMLLPDMEKAVVRLRDALRAGETVGIFGDFDTDGVTGTALLASALRDLGIPVVPYLPHRVDEGHGLNEHAVRILRDQGVTLLVTVDCGATSVDEVALATSLGIDSIITDHHTLHDGSGLPAACAIVNPRRHDSSYPYPHLTGVGMSYKLVEALYADLGRSRPDHLLELVALGTVADLGPLTGENRYLVKQGLKHLNATQNPGIQALVSCASLRLGSLDTEALAFGLIPRLNAAGRLDHASTSLDLLTATSLEMAKPLAAELERRNIERRLLTRQGVREAEQQVEAEIEANGIPSIILVGSENWAPGILGLIAGKLADSYYRPVVAVSLGEVVSRASARSIPEFNVVGALRETQEEFIRVGGHPQAAGFTIATTSLHRLRGALRALAAERLDGLELVPQIQIDCEVSPTLLVGDNRGFIESLSPFGEGNPAPVFVTTSAQVMEARTVGDASRHLKMRLRHGGSIWDAIAFEQGDRMDVARDEIDLVYTLGVDTWGANPKLQLTVLNLRPASAQGAAD